ncbi:MAG: pentapeptide repeat-containing protein [Oculatellaceae cyanobacterium bins.114]|nr:pentapeptide repeat-containing protein [Oculatellaceae cyanobacterium bins.114]
MATITAGVGLYLTYQNSQQERQLNTERLITDRFGKAVEQLGSSNIAVKVGGIYALERVAKDSPKDHWTVMEVLTTYVREQLPLPEEINSELSKSIQSGIAKLPADVQSALTAIGRRNGTIDDSSNVLDLSRSNLARANLARGNFSSINFADAILSRSELSDANFSHANLANATLTRANLINTDLTGANLTGAGLADATLIMADLSDTNLSDTNFTGANLSGANLSGANLARANFTGAIISCVTIPIAIADMSSYPSPKQCVDDVFIDLSNVVNLTEQQLGAAKVCKAKLPEYLKFNPDSGCKELGIEFTPERF